MTLLSAVRRLMPITSIAHTSYTPAHLQLQRRLAHICPASAYTLSSHHCAMSSVSSASASTNPVTSSTTSTTSSATTSVTYTPHHSTLPEIQPHHRVLFIGDIHGCYDELQQLITAAAITPGTDYILLAGDLIGKGPRPLDVIQWLTTTPRAYSVMGNHDHHVVRAMQRQAGGDTPANLSYETHPHDYVAHHLTPTQRHYYLTALPLTIRLPSLHPPHLLVHAGLVPGRAVEEQAPFDLMNVRNVLADGSGSKKKSDGVNWVERYKGEEGVVVFGHCAARGVQLVKEEGDGGRVRCIGLDSGCCYGKELSGWLLPENRLVQVKAHRMYANPDE